MPWSAGPSRVTFAASSRELFPQVRVALDEVDEPTVLRPARAGEAQGARLADPDGAAGCGCCLGHVASSPSILLSVVGPPRASPRRPKVRPDGIRRMSARGASVAPGDRGQPLVVCRE